MNLDLNALLLILPPLLMLEGLFSGSEIALLSADKNQLKSKAAKGSNAAELALSLAKNPERVLTSTLVMTALCVIAISGIITIYTKESGFKNPDLAAVAISSPLVVFFGELIPKAIYRRYATILAPFVAYPVSLAYLLLYPITRVLSSYTYYLSKLLRPLEELLTGKPPTARDELLSLLSYGKRESEITASERAMIKRIIDFKGTQAKHILVPLIRVEAIEERATVKDAIERFKIHRHSRIPVYSGRIDNIIGVLSIAELFLSQDSTQPIRNFISPARYVAETHLIDDLLPEMQKQKTEIVVVVDEYGGAIGILTFEDIVEEIVGEINDEHDDQLEEYRELGIDRWLLQARMEIAVINEKLKLELPEGDYETVGGFLLSQFSKLPEVGDELYFDTPAGSFKFSIRKANERQIQAITLEKIQIPTSHSPKE